MSFVNSIIRSKTDKYIYIYSQRQGENLEKARRNQFIKGNPIMLSMDFSAETVSQEGERCFI